MTKSDINWYWINLRSGTPICGGIAVDEDIVIETCPYFRWMIGMEIGTVRN